MPRRVDILGVLVDAQTLNGAIDTIGSWIDRHDPHYVCVTGVHGVVECQDDDELRRIHNAAGMVTTDGMPLVWLSRRRVPDGTPVERVYGPDLMLDAFARSESTGWRHFLYGAAPATLDRLRVNLRARFPGRRWSARSVLRSGRSRRPRTGTSPTPSPPPDPTSSGSG